MTPLRHLDRLLSRGIVLALLALAACFIGLVGLVVVAFGPLAAAERFDVVTGTMGVEVPVDAPATVTAGDELALVAGPFPGTQGTVEIIVTGTYGTNVTTARVVDGLAELTLPGSATVRSGRVTIRVDGAGGHGDAAVEVTPRPAVAPVTPLVGARAIRADGEHWAMVVAIPQDDLGNPVADGTAVDLRVLHPDGEEERSRPAVTHGLAWARVFSTTTAGRARISTSVGDASGPEADLLEVAGPPAELVLERDPGPLVADGRMLTTVRTSRMRDAFGNEVPDGTVVRFTITDADGVRVVDAPAVNGVAETVVEAPTVAGTTTVTPSAAGLVGSPFQLSYAAPVPSATASALAVSARLVSEEVEVRIGPVLGDLGQHVPDGTLATVTLRGPSGDTVRKVALEGGVAAVRIWVGDGAPREVTVTVGSRSRTVSVSR